MALSVRGGFCLFAVMLFSSHKIIAAGPEVSLTTASGEKLTGSLNELTESSVSVSVDERSREFATKDLLELAFPHERTKSELFGAAIFLANGDRLLATPETIDDTKALARWAAFPFWKSVEIPLETISGFILEMPEIAAVRSQAVRTVLNRQQNTDLADLKNGDQAAGEFVELNETTLTLSGNAGETPIPRSSIRLVTMNRELISFPNTEGIKALVSMTDGSRITASRLAFDGKDQLTVKAAFGAEFELPISAVTAIRFLGGRAVYLSDLTPTKYEHEPYLASEWEVKTDLNVLGEPLRIDGVEYPKGLGMHSQSLVSYDIADGYESFHATLGVDDAAGNRGSVIFAVEVDGKTVYQSEPQTGKDDAITLPAVPLDGAKTLTLKVLFAEFGDVLDYANWTDAVLVK